MMLPSRGRNTTPVAQRTPACSLFPSLFIYACALSSLWMDINNNGDTVKIHWGTERDRQNVNCPPDGMGRERQWLTGTTVERIREREQGMRDGWRAEEKRRDQHGTNCFLCTPAAPPSAIHHPTAIGPAPTLWQMRPSSPSVTTAATYVGACVWSREGDRLCACVFVCVRVCACRVSERLYDKEMIACLSADEFVFPMVEKKKNPNTFFIFFLFGATPSISCGKSNGKSSARAFCMMLTLICTLVWKASRHHVEN